MKALRKSSYVDRHRAKRSQERRAERFEHYVGLMLRFLQCLTCNKTADFRNQGELSEFARHFVSVGLVHVLFNVIGIVCVYNFSRIPSFYSDRVLQMDLLNYNTKVSRKLVLLSDTLSEKSF